ncbi:MAG: helix-turn-helix transcriptional regulator [Proteobacteria bacterium]|nr:helix-turn-helix transcriptional regulator [Pseudomonadota bacterium]MBU4471910.1 helix-turn-helix transcriptional regulator [Pseudomonadota bacterium]MCG2752814.1 helix-turn-helix transcriptional regulator [Desulfobacteraceae bacterium]
MQKLLSTKEVAQLLGINEKMVYTLVAEKALPATKITGKWLFPRHLVEQWVEANTINYPQAPAHLPPYEGLLIIAGSNDPLLEKAISLFNSTYTEHIAVFGNLGSLGGLKALRQNLCHMASSHLLQDNEQEYNFEFAQQELENAPAIVNFCKREQGIILQKGNPKNIQGISDLVKPGIKIINRSSSTGTRLLFDKALQAEGIRGDDIEGFYHVVYRHMDVGLAVLSGSVDAGPGIRAVATLLGLDFIPLRWERYDLLISKERFFDKGVQLFISMLHEDIFQEMAKTLDGYDLSTSGKMVFKTDSPHS